MTVHGGDHVRPGLRERKKLMTRQAILAAAGRLFEERGFDGTTVAQIADAANVSVKTLFKYFDSKEDLVFGDENGMRDALIAAVRDRPPGQSALDAVRQFLHQLAGLDGGSGLEGFHRAFGGVPALRSRMLLLFERYELALTPVLAAEAGTPPDDPGARIAAAQLISLLRLITSPQAREWVNDRPTQEHAAALRQWITDCADLLAGGLANYAVRPGPVPRQDRTVDATPRTPQISTSALESE
ncbi:TetR/AcrR family transcriptional regulator [Streptomyces sp. NPDC051554]|uniref:TetR/AcrR family transcriptional regulator n=1 Tax=Streptomyces sp. NPDC051554 TaxID=3365656 RepID=UPI00379141C6